MVTVKDSALCRSKRERGRSLADTKVAAGVTKLRDDKTVITCNTERNKIHEYIKKRES